MTPSEVATKYVGQTEKPQNMGFTDEEFERKMIAVGFHKKDSWCSYFQELVFKEAYPERFVEMDRLFSANANQTFHNFKAAGFKIGMDPVVDSLVVFQLYKDSKPVNIGTEDKPIWPGHIGVVVKVDQNDHGRYDSIEGNTNDKGGREGYIVAVKSRRVNLDVKDGLKVIGFIQV